MASLHSTLAIVLSRSSRREVDRWYSAYTKDFGKIEFMARGADKPLAKLSPHLEMAAELELLLVNGRYYWTIAGVERKQAFPDLHLNLNKLLLAKNSKHFVDIGTRAHEKDERVYDHLLSWFEFLQKIPEVSQERSAYLLGSFVLKLLAIMGYRPELTNCLACRSVIKKGSYAWHALKGGVVCSDCVLKNNNTWFTARAISDDVLKLLRFALQEDFSEQLRPHLLGVLIPEFHNAVESLLISHFPTIPANTIRESCIV
ncbi:MAG: DNA repair protein RecO [Patescibacteria group bacterium]